MVYVFIGAAVILAVLIGLFWAKKGDRSGPTYGGSGGGSWEGREDEDKERKVE